MTFAPDPTPRATVGIDDAPSLDTQQQRLLAAIPRDEWLTTQEIADRAGVPVATAYRKIRPLRTLLETKRRPVPDGGGPEWQLRRPFDVLELTFDTDADTDGAE